MCSIALHTIRQLTSKRCGAVWCVLSQTFTYGNNSTRSMLPPALPTEVELCACSARSTATMRRCDSATTKHWTSFGAHQQTSTRSVGKIGLVWRHMTPISKGHCKTRDGLGASRSCAPLCRRQLEGSRHRTLLLLMPLALACGVSLLLPLHSYIIFCRCSGIMRMAAVSW